MLTAYSQVAYDRPTFPLTVTPNLPTGVAFQAPVTFNNSIDGNVTMKRLASADVFNQECTSLFERMINTVPSTVTLTDPVEPINYKVSGTMLHPRDGSLAFLATLRILDSSFFEKPNTTVTMFWKERQGTFCPEAGCSVESFQLDYDIASLMALDTYGIFQMDLFRFNATIDLNTSISHFWFVVDPKNGSAPFIVDNHGANFTIDQDVVLYDAGRSSFTNSGTVMVVAVKDDSGNTSVTANTMVSGNPLAPGP
ncbi:Peroxidase [Mycena venus]|uniref:Peroxidase n=1 Tax=Mycena venus TaxID=2733690 RepID=A0A8H6U2V4_9AGAR|nr:Peroxidase [Mycena venus]